MSSHSSSTSSGGGSVVLSTSSVMIPRSRRTIPLRDGRRLMDSGDTNQPPVVPKGDAHRVFDAATIGRPAFDTELRQIE